MLRVCAAMHAGQVLWVLSMSSAVLGCMLLAANSLKRDLFLLLSGLGIPTRGRTFLCNLAVQSMSLHWLHTSLACRLPHGRCVTSGVSSISSEPHGPAWLTSCLVRPTMANLGASCLLLDSS